MREVSVVRWLRIKTLQKSPILSFAVSYNRELCLKAFFVVVVVDDDDIQN